MLRSAQVRKADLRRFVALAIGLGAALLIVLFAVAGRLEAAAPKPLYPDLKTIKPDPTSLQFDTMRKRGETQHLLRFSNTVWNRGEGALDLRGKTVTTSSGKKKTKVYQRIYDRKGNFKRSEALGQFVFHPAHDHFHFGSFAKYELWKKAKYDRWVRKGQPDWRATREGTKTTFCVMDTENWRDIAGNPGYPVYDGCGKKRQGLSVGWADTYTWELPDQYIVLGTTPLADGSYVLRSVADPDNRIYESRTKKKWRESQKANSAVTYFTLSDGIITTE